MPSAGIFTRQDQSSLRSRQRLERHETSNAAWLVSEGQATSCRYSVVVVVRKGCTTLPGQRKVLLTNTRWVEQAEVEMVEGRGGGRLKRVPKLPASDDQSVHQRGLRGARWNSSAGRTKKHPPWESAFFCRQMPSDGLGRPVRTQCILWREGLCWAGVCQKNTSTLLLECTKIFKSSIFISLFHTLDVRMDMHTNGGIQQKVWSHTLYCTIHWSGWSKDNARMNISAALPHVIKAKIRNQQRLNTANEGCGKQGEISSSVALRFPSWMMETLRLRRTHQPHLPTSRVNSID